MRSSVLAWSLLCLVAGCAVPGTAGPEPRPLLTAEAARPNQQTDGGAPDDTRSSERRSPSDEAVQGHEHDDDFEESEVSDEEHDEHGEEDGAYSEAEGPESGGTSTSTAPSETPRRQVRSLDGLSRAELLRLLEDDREALGPLSVGLPNSGRLFNGSQLPESKLFHLVSPNFAWGTQETLDALSAAVRRVHREFPGTPPLFVGHLSSKGGGHLRPHLSHQSGRDVDLGFYYVDKPRWYTRASAENLDVARTWALVRALVVETDVEMILIDQSVIEMLRRHALAQGEAPSWIERVFSNRNGGRAIVRHVRGHRTHLHVRFFNPEAQQRAQQLYPLLVEKQLVPPVTVYATFRAKRGDTLGKIAKRYGSTVEELKRANGLKKSLIVAGRVYKIPRKGGPRPIEQKLAFPPRLLPPAPEGPAPLAATPETPRTGNDAHRQKSVSQPRAGKPNARSSKTK